MITKQNQIYGILHFQIASRIFTHFFLLKSKILAQNKYLQNKTKQIRVSTHTILLLISLH